MKVIVTVKKVNESQVRDLEVPADLTAAALSEKIASALGWDKDLKGNDLYYNIEVHPPGRILESEETLAQADAWDGSWLVFHPRSKPHKSALASASTRSQGPMEGWHPIGTNTSSSDADKSSFPEGNHLDVSGKSSGFVWRQIDDD